MTNEEKILNAFPNATARIIENKDFRYIEVEQNDEWIADFNIEWWHSEYKEPCKIDKNFEDKNFKLLTNYLRKLSS